MWKIPLGIIMGIIGIGLLIDWHRSQTAGGINDPEWQKLDWLLFCNGWVWVPVFDVVMLTCWVMLFEKFFRMAAAQIQLPDMADQMLFWVFLFGTSLLLIIILISLEFEKLETNEGGVFSLFGTWIKNSGRRKGWYLKLPLIMKLERIGTHPRITHYGFVNRTKNADGSYATEAKGFIVRGKDGIKITVHGTINWVIKDMKNAIIHGTKEIHGRLESLLQEQLIREAKPYTWKEIYKNPEYLASPAQEKKFIKKLQDEADNFKYGIEIQEIQTGDMIAPEALVAELTTYERELIQKKYEKLQQDHFNEMVVNHIKRMKRLGKDVSVKEAEQFVLFTAGKHPANTWWILGFENLKHVNITSPLPTPGGAGGGGRGPRPPRGGGGRGPRGGGGAGGGTI